jgi:hypothetical protein
MRPLARTLLTPRTRITSRMADATRLISPIRVELHSSDETVEILIEADLEALPEERRRLRL